jgi:hypothetical protein
MQGLSIDLTEKRGEHLFQNQLIRFEFEILDLGQGHGRTPPRSVEAHVTGSEFHEGLEGDVWDAYILSDNGERWNPARGVYELDRMPATRLILVDPSVRYYQLTFFGVLED